MDVSRVSILTISFILLACLSVARGYLTLLPGSSSFSSSSRHSSLSSAGERRSLSSLHAPPLTRLSSSAAESEWNTKEAEKLDFTEDFYSVLEVDPSASQADLKRQYYKIVFKYHPDNKVTEKEKALSNKQMMVINAAYKVLKDPDARAKYDMKRLNSSASASTTTAAKTSSSSSSRGGVGQSTSSRSSSSFSYYSPEREEVDEDLVGESLGDIVSDLLRGAVSDNGRKSIFDDFVTFLEGNSGSSDSNNEDEALNPSQREVISKTLTNLQSHLEDIEAELRRSVGRRGSISSSSSSVASGVKQGGDLAARLKLEEEISALEAKRTAVKVFWSILYRFEA